MSGNDEGWAAQPQFPAADADAQPITDDDDKEVHMGLVAEVDDDSASIKSHGSDQQVEVGSLGEDDNEPLDISFEEFFPLEEGRHEGQTTHSFCGALWRLLVIIDKASVGVFAVVANMQDLPTTWAAHVRFSFTLVHPTTEEASLRSNEDRFKFHWVSGLYQDRGFPSCFNRAVAEKLQHESGKLLIRCTLGDANWIPPPYNSKKATGMVGIQNLGATCYLNSLLQMLHHLNSFRKAVYDIPVNEEDTIDSSMTLAMQGVFYHLQTGDTEVSTHDLTKAFGWDSLEAFQQQDVQEMMRILLDRLEEKMKKTPVDGMVQRLFEGKVQSYIRCIDVDFSSKREEAFYDIQLDVKGCKNLYQSFERYVAKEMLNGENQYEAEGFGKQDAEKGVIFHKFPPVLTIHLKRFEFDLARFGFSKIHDRFEFPTRICLDDFVADDAPPEHKQGNNYILHSVLVHGGDVMGGHYTAFIRPSPPNDYNQWVRTADADVDADAPDQGSQWFKFDDEVVSKSSEHDAVIRNFGDGLAPGMSPLTVPRRIVSLSSAYMLVYIRESEVLDIMKPISEEEIPAVLKQRLEDEEKRKRRAEVVRLEEKRYMAVSYATERDVAEFRDYSARFDFVQPSKLPRLRILRTASMVGLMRALACELQVPPCRLRLWPVIHRENSTTRIDVLPERPVFAEMARSVYVEVLPENPQLARYAQKLDELDAEEARLLKHFGIRSPPYSWRNGPVDRSLTQHDDINPSEALLYGVGIGMGTELPNTVLANKLQALEEQYDELMQDVQRMYRRDENEHLIFFKLFDPHASEEKLRYLGSMLFDMEQDAQALYDAAIQLAELTPEQARTARVYEELTPNNFNDIFEADGHTLAEKQNTTGDIFIVELQAADGDSDSSESGHEVEQQQEQGDVEQRLESLFEAKTAARFFRIHATRKMIKFIPATKSDEVLFQAAMEAWQAGGQMGTTKLLTQWLLNNMDAPELHVQLLTDTKYGDACAVVSRRLGIADPLRVQLLPLSENRRIRPYHSPADMLRARVPISQLIGGSKSTAPLLKVAVTPFPCTIDGDIRLLEINVVDARLRQQRRQYLLELQASHSSNGGGASPTTSEESRIAWQMDEPIDQNIALTEPELCLPVPADALSDKIIFAMADPSQSLGRLAAHVRHRCGLSDQFEGQLEAEVRGFEKGRAHNGGVTDNVANGSESPVPMESKAGTDAEENTAQLPLRVRFTTTEARSMGTSHGVLLFTASMQKIERIFLPTDVVHDISPSWMEYPTAARLDRLNAQLVTETEARFMLRRAPVNSIPVRVLFFTMYGQTAQALQESDMFVTYLREDDTMDTLLMRLARITGDPDRVVDKYRLAVIRNFMPSFLHREVDDAATTKKRTRDSPNQVVEEEKQQKKTKIVEEGDGEAEMKVAAEPPEDSANDENVQPMMQMGEGVNGNEGGSDTSDADSEQRPTVWAKFQRAYPMHMGDGNRSVLLNIDDYPILGIQRPSGSEWSSRRIMQRFATGIKIR